ncbi:MAG: thioredoxin domain-containing protein [Vicinamibacterales bacterium]
MNRLAREKSPYLLQHADNPVDWYPWGDEAFEKSRSEDKPIFLSVGYSTCHWCHVMERESFEDHAVARALNESFVPVKVDREERPDIDRVYMTFVQATTGSGGWPMSVWLTPELEPFYGGTYFPPATRWGRPGFIDILARIAALWREERGEVRRQASHVSAQLRAMSERQEPGQAPHRVVLDRAVEELAGRYDRQYGGFGAAPKFPRPAELLLLLREHARTGKPGALEMAVATLEAMVNGGMRDQIGGGFHRYSVDRMWRVPHFEKMLYDQAQITLALLEAGQASGRKDLVEAAADTLRYVLRDLADERGGFYSAEDADSIPAGPAPPVREGGAMDEGSPKREEVRARAKAEGAFYTWSRREIDALLGDDAPIFRMRFGVRPDGNAPGDPHGEFAGLNILYVARPTEDIARETGRPPEEVTETLERSRRVLFEARSKRPRPHLDDKVLTAWNGLMIAAFARAARVVRAAGYDRAFAGSCLRAARRAAGFIREAMWRSDGTLLRRYRDGDASIEAYAEDYAFLIFGLLELFQSDGDPEWIDWALALQRRQNELFLDEKAGGWFSTTGTDESVLVRLKEEYDGAEPSPSSVTAFNLAVLIHLTGRPEFQAPLDSAFRCFGNSMSNASSAVPMMLAAFSMHVAGLGQVVIAGRRDAADTLALQRVLEARYRPFLIRIPLDPNRRPSAATGGMLPFTESMAMVGGRATAYVCRDFACELPASEPGQLEHRLG